MRPKQRRALESARTRGVRQAKRKLGVDAVCQVCGWKPPIVNVLSTDDRVRGLHGHHVIPVAEGGSLEPSNVVILCPNHHTMAHVIGDLAYRKWRDTRGSFMPIRDRLLHWLNLIDTKPAKFCAEVARFYPGVEFRVPTEITPLHPRFSPLRVTADTTVAIPQGR